jgi:hypothetical protein
MVFPEDWHEGSHHVKIRFRRSWHLWHDAPFFLNPTVVCRQLCSRSASQWRAMNELIAVSVSCLCFVLSRQASHCGVALPQECVQITSKCLHFRTWQTDRSDCWLFYCFMSTLLYTRLERNTI